MKKIHVIGLVVIAAAIGILITVLGNTSEYATFGMVKDHPGKVFHIVGTWDRSPPVEYAPQKDPNYFAFAMKDSLGGEEKVVLRSERPQEFEHSEKIVVVGKMEGDNFEASNILMKCPSKYTNQSVEAKPVSEPKAE